MAKKKSPWYNAKLENCPQKHLHTPAPERYLAWHQWAEAMIETHNQKESLAFRQGSVNEETAKEKNNGKS